MDDVCDVAAGVEHRRVAGTPPALLELAALLGGPSDVVLLHRHGVRRAALRRGSETGMAGVRGAASAASEREAERIRCGTATRGIHHVERMLSRSSYTGSTPHAGSTALRPSFLGLVTALVLLTPLSASAAPATAGPTSVPALVAIVMGFGGLGGFVDGLTTDIVYRVNFGGRSVDIGSLGDVLAGSTAAIAIFTVGNALFPEMQLKSFGTDLGESIRIIALSVLSGYAGVRLLNPLTRKLVEQISTDKVQEAARSFKARDEELVINIKEGDRMLYRFDIEKDKLFAEKNTARASELLEGATRSFEIALRMDPLDAEALMGLAKAARRRAEVKELAGASPEADWILALQFLDRITGNNPRAARAFYNKACYRQIRQKGKELAADSARDLTTAFELQPALKQRAASDPDFAAVRDTESFKALIHAA
ncbi:hypothetical protein OV079_50520 [Nannocystis pusilla]|uniref:Tetratricopeptide repeat protein n=1 Tax=Nannocystis pusilla TaxID=889268 RepID=A0A9X3J501_9BACT|nr:hypothetical protein [Nannocystis pusilla]MCY1013633.1 hypothetical protein [Nannocystis pusilla]